MERLKLNQSGYSDIAGVLCLFLFCVILHAALYFTVFNFPRAPRVWDEARYYDIARSLFNGDGLRIRNILTTMQKIGYPLMIMPFFAISDVVARLKAIGMASIFVMSLSVIFVWLVCSELKLGRRAKYCIVFFTAIWPDMMYSMSHASEVLYWPLTVLFFWVWLVNQRKQSFFISICAGLLCYFMYLTKEVALAFIIAYIAFEFLWPALCFSLKESGEKKTLREFYSKRKFMLLALFLASFMICHISMKMTFFSSMENYYIGQMGIRAVMSPYRFMYTIYAFFYYIAAVLAASFVIPMAYPVANFRLMNEEGRKFFCYIVLFSLVVCATIAYTISVRENRGEINPTIHLRYYGSFFVMLIAVFFSSMQAAENEGTKHSGRLAAEILALMVIYTCFMFRGTTLASSIEQYILLWYSVLDKICGFILSLNLGFKDSALLLPPEGKWQVFYPSAVIAGIIFASFAFIFHRKYIRKGALSAQKFYVIALLIATLGLNAAAGAVVRYAYRVDGRTAAEIMKINAFFSNELESNILYLVYGAYDERYDYYSRYTDTFMDRRKRFYIVNYDELAKHIEGNTVSVNNISLETELKLGTYENIQGIDYILVENTDSSGHAPLSGTKPVKELCGKHFTLYKNLSRDVIHFKAE